MNALLSWQVAQAMARDARRRGAAPKRPKLGRPRGRRRFP
jgi:hypothetical protein